MIIETLLATTVALLLGGAAYLTWRQRETARKEADLNRKLAEIGESVDALAHDLGNLLQVLDFSVLKASEAEDEEERLKVLSDLGMAMGSAKAMLSALRMRTGAQKKPVGSVEGIVRLTASLLRRAGNRVEIDVGGDMRYDGPDVPVIRIIQNLLFNAVREASSVTHGRVKVEIQPDRLTIVNPVRDPADLDERIYLPGRSGVGSSGSGLAIAREAAEDLGWTISHEVVSDRAGQHRVRFHVNDRRRLPSAS